VIKVIPAYPMYQAHSDGYIIGLSGNILKPRDSGRGYLRVVVRKESCKPINMAIHRLMANAFLDLDIEDKSIEVHHKDEVKANCKLSNLELKLQGEHRRQRRDYLYVDDTETHRRCHLCGEIRSREEFYTNTSTRDGQSPYCKPCMTARYYRR